jgi:hypothetical protein
MSFETAVDGGVRFPALVVKPCPLLETVIVRQRVEKIADKVMDIYSHYRFYVLCLYQRFYRQ